MKRAEAAAGSWVEMRLRFPARLKKHPSNVRLVLTGLRQFPAKEPPTARGCGSFSHCPCISEQRTGKIESEQIHFSVRSFVCLIPNNSLLLCGRTLRNMA